jgi:hypothetical protein
LVTLDIGLFANLLRFPSVEIDRRTWRISERMPFGARTASTVLHGKQILKNYLKLPELLISYVDIVFKTLPKVPKRE